MGGFYIAPTSSLAQRQHDVRGVASAALDFPFRDLAVLRIAGEIVSIGARDRDPNSVSRGRQHRGRPQLEGDLLDLARLKRPGVRAQKAAVGTGVPVGGAVSEVLRESARSWPSVT